MKRGYTVEVRSAPFRLLSDDELDAFSDAIFRDRRLAGPSVSADGPTRRLSVRTSVGSGRPQDALDVAVCAFVEAAKSAGLVKIGLAEMTVEDERFSGGEDRHELVSGAEVARRIGVTRERVRQLAEAKGRFPRPLASVGAYRVWRWGDIIDWAAVDGRRLRRTWT